jgi:hypothetical protein
MRIVALLALAVFGALALSFPAAAQETAAAESVPKLDLPTFTAPVRLAPPAAEPAPQQAAPQPMVAAPLPTFSTPERLMNWIVDYRKHRNASRVPEAVHAMEELGLFADEEKAGFCTGFIAGVLGDNPKSGSALIARMFPLPDKDQAVIIKAIAYSGRPDWRDLLEKYRARMPLRGPLIDDYLAHRRGTLMEADLAQGSPIIYTLWGYYVATGHYEPVVRIMQALRWSKNADDHSFSWSKIWAGWKSDPSAVDKITTGGTAKWTLASYGERNRDLLALYRAEYDRQPEDIARPLKDVIEAAEVFESEKVRKDQFGAIQDAQKMQATNEAGMSKAATAGSIAIATGCVAASALGQVYIAVPCVIGGALYTGAVKLMH